MHPKTGICKRVANLILSLDQRLSQLYGELEKIDRILRGRPAKGYIEWKYVRCGKKRCSCMLGAGHGPYAYLRYWEDGTLKSVYLGKSPKTLVPPGQKQELQQYRRRILQQIENIEQKLEKIEQLLLQP